MSKNEIVSMIETMNNYDELASKAKAKADAIRDALKEEMLRLDTEELNAGAYILRYTNIISNRLPITRRSHPLIDNASIIIKTTMAIWCFFIVLLSPLSLPFFA